MKDHEQTKLGSPIVETAPGETQAPIKLLRDTDCECLAFSYFQVVEINSFFSVNSTFLEGNSVFQRKEIEQIGKVLSRF